VNIDTVKLPSESESKTKVLGKDAYSLMMNTRGNEQRELFFLFVMNMSEWKKDIPRRNPTKWPWLV